MKFSYPLLKKFLPKLPNKAKVIDALSLHSFEAENAEGNAIEVSLPPNRYSDAASHLGIARELSAIFNISIDTKAIKDLPLGEQRPVLTKVPKKFSVSVQDKKLCPRYSAQYFENIKIAPSPQWMQDALLDCGMRPINNVVDIMNYVMWETGQPLHAFDYDTLAGKKGAEIVVRHAKAHEAFTTIDGASYTLSPEMLVIADAKKPLVIAGVKGGAGCEVTDKTTRILVEAANFDFVSILKTSRKLGLATDASQRFSHNMSPALVETALSRAAQLLKGLASAKAGERYDSFSAPLAKHVIAFDIEEFKKRIGIALSEKEAAGYLKQLGFKNVKKNLWEVPAIRTDIETHDDLAEEVARLYGYQNINAEAPRASLLPPETNEMVALNELARTILTGFGFDEVMNHSFVAKDALTRENPWKGEAMSLVNPTSAEFEYLRPLLAYGLIENVNANARYFDAVRIFEVGDVFVAKEGNIYESTHLALALKEKDEMFFDLKGMVAHLLKGLGLVDVSMKELASGKHHLFAHGGLEITVDEKTVGYLGIVENKMSLAEFDMAALLPLVEGEHEYEPLQKYPSVMRDISMFVSTDVRIGEVIKAIQETDMQYIFDVDLMDEYIDAKWANLQSITLRIVFQAKERTLTGDEVDEKMKTIGEVLGKKFGAKLR